MVLKPLRNILGITLGFMSGPGVLFLLPYILVQAQFANVAKVIFYLQVVSVVGVAGLDVAGVRLNVRLTQVVCLASLTTLLVAVPLAVFNWEDSLTLVLIAILAGAGSVYSLLWQYYLITKPDIQGYAVFGFVRAAVLLLLFWVLLSLGVDADFGWGVAVLAAFLTAAFLTRNVLFLSGVDIVGVAGIKQIFKMGFPVFFISGIGTIPITLDRFMAGNCLPEFEFARYVAVSTFGLPIVYFGGLYLQYMLSRDSILDKRGWIGGVKVLALVSLAYVIVVSGLAVDHIPIPYFNDKSDFLSIWLLISGWYVLLVSAAYPSALVMQKLSPPDELLRLAKVTALFSPLAIFLGVSLPCGALMPLGAVGVLLSSVVMGVLIISHRVYYAWKRLHSQ